MKFAKDQNGLNLYHGTIVIDVRGICRDAYRVIGISRLHYIVVERVSDGAIFEKYERSVKVKNAPYQSALIYGCSLPDYFVKEWNEMFIDEDIEQYLFENDERVLEYLNS